MPELQAQTVEIRALRERMDRMEARLERQDEKFERIFATLERHDEKFERIFATLQRHSETLQRHSETLEKQNEKFERIFGILGKLEKSQQVILDRIDYAERISDLEVRFGKLEQYLKKAS